jgi:DNA-binding transcriptional LysR family regulator
VDRFDAMAVFVAVADLRGFAPAARRMGLSPSAVTRLVAALEEHLNTRLLQRTTRSVTLTDAGTRYLERAKRILSDVAEAEGAAQSERSVPTGRFVLAAPSVFGRLHVAPLMSDFLAKYPAVKGELVLGNRMANLVEEGVDAAVRIGVLEDSSYVARQVGATRRVVVASPQYLSRRKKPRSPEDLKRHDVIQFTALTPTRDWRFFYDGHESSFPVAARYVTNSAAAAIVHAEIGAGLAMLLSYQVIEAVRAGRLEVVLRGFEPPPHPIQIVYPTTRLLSAKVRAFVELVVATRDWRFVDV